MTVYRRGAENEDNYKPCILRFAIVILGNSTKSDSTAEAQRRRGAEKTTLLLLKRGGLYLLPQSVVIEMAEDLFCVFDLFLVFLCASAVRFS